MKLQPMLPKTDKKEKSSELDEFLKGLDEEMQEHKIGRELAEKLVQDHLAKDPEYYDDEDSGESEAHAYEGKETEEEERLEPCKSKYLEKYKAKYGRK